MRSIDRLTVPFVVLWAAVLPGCGPDTSAKPPPVAEAHDHTAPHGGALLELGEEEAHVEVLHDRKAATLTVWVYGKSLSAPVAVEAPTIQLASKEGPKELKGVALDAKPGVTAATSWKYTDPALDADPLEGRIRVTVDGKAHQSPLEPEGHAHK
jgi:hypothetical protein